MGACQEGSLVGAGLGWAGRMGEGWGLGFVRWVVRLGGFLCNVIGIGKGLWGMAGR